MSRDERWRIGSYDESPTSILGAAVRALEALDKEVMGLQRSRSVADAKKSS
jgi:hypothetical protein